MELLIVISIIVILMLIAIPTANTIRKRTDEALAQNSADDRAGAGYVCD